eukprot:364094-Amphidinium_carterae.1
MGAAAGEGISSLNTREGKFLVAQALARQSSVHAVRDVIPEKMFASLKATGHHTFAGFKSQTKLVVCGNIRTRSDHLLKGVTTCLAEKPLGRDM